MAQTPSGVGTAFLYDTQVSGSGGYTDIISAFPPSANVPVIFEPNPSLSAGQISIWIVVTGPGEDWGGCQIWASVDGGTSYGQLGSMMWGGVQGLLTATCPSGAEIDTVSSIQVDTSMCSGQIDTASATDADLGVTLAYVDGELIGYSNVVLVDVDQYTLDTHLHRGMFDTPIGAHASGSQFALIGGQVFSHTYPSIMIGTTVNFKFPSFNSVGGNMEDISTLPSYSYTLTGGGLARGIWATPFAVGAHIVDMVQDPWDGNYEIFSALAPWDINFDENLEKSPVPGCSVAPTADVTFTMQIVTNAGSASTVGTMVIPSGSLVGHYTCAGFAITGGDRLRLYAPLGVNATISGLYGTIIGARN